MKGDQLNASERESQLHKIAVFYPSESLMRQLKDWAGGRADCAIQKLTVRAADAVRRSIRQADMVMVDATEDSEQAVDVFSLGLAQFGASRTAMYTEQMHEGLEHFVRVQGSLLLLGPLSQVQWEDLLRVMLETEQTKPRWGKVA